MLWVPATELLLGHFVLPLLQLEPEHDATHSAGSVLDLSANPLRLPDDLDEPLDPFWRVLEERTEGTDALVKHNAAPRREALLPVLVESIAEVLNATRLCLRGVGRAQLEVSGPLDKTITAKAKSLTERKRPKKSVIIGLPQVFDRPLDQALGLQDSQALFELMLGKLFDA